jgi:hypothetical protein
MQLALLTVEWGGQLLLLLLLLHNVQCTCNCFICPVVVDQGRRDIH